MIRIICHPRPLSLRLFADIALDLTKGSIDELIEGNAREAGPVVEDAADEVSCSKGERFDGECGRG